MATISQKALDEFNLLYQKEYGIELSPDKLIQEAQRVLLLMKTVYRPIPKPITSLDTAAPVQDNIAELNKPIGITTQG